MRARSVATAVATAALVGGAVAVAAIAVPTIATAARVGAPADPAPAVTVTVRVTVPAAPAGTPSASASAYAGPLIGAAGWRVRSRAELHEWVSTRTWAADSADGGAIWEQQAWLDMRCMAQAGYLYDPVAQGEQDAQGVGLTDAQRAGYRAAMDGPPTSDPYDWRRAGCHGRSVHLTGQDDAH